MKTIVRVGGEEFFPLYVCIILRGKHTSAVWFSAALLHYFILFPHESSTAFSRVPAGVYWSDSSFRFIISSLYKCVQMLLRTWAPNPADHKLAFKMYIKGTDKCFSAIPNDLWGQGERNCMNLLMSQNSLYRDLHEKCPILCQTDSLIWKETVLEN